MPDRYTTARFMVSNPGVLHVRAEEILADMRTKQQLAVARLIGVEVQNPTSATRSAGNISIVI